MDRTIVDELVRLTSAPTKSERASGKVTQVSNDGTVWVRLDGSTCETPCERRSVEASPGDVVSVTVRGGRGIVDGNYSKPATDDEAASSAMGKAEEALTAADLAKLLALTQTHAHINAEGNVDAPTKPSDYAGELRFSGARSYAALGIPGTGTASVFGMCGNQSGGGAWEVALCEGMVLCRTTVYAGSQPGWGPWQRLLRDMEDDFGPPTDLAATVVPAFDSDGSLCRRTIPMEYDASHWDDHWQACYGGVADASKSVHVIRRGGTVTVRGSNIIIANASNKVNTPIAQLAVGYRPKETVNTIAGCNIWVSTDGGIYVEGAARDGRTVTFNATYAVA